MFRVFASAVAFWVLGLSQATTTVAAIPTTPVATVPTPPEPPVVESAPAAPSVSSAPSARSESSRRPRRPDSGFSRYVGMSYFVFFDGPGLAPEARNFTPNNFGRGREGLTTRQLISIKGKLSDSWALDFQTRTTLTYNNAFDSPRYEFYRWESPRIGISGRLLSGDDWALIGAVNTDFPYFVPAPFGGGTAARAQTTLFTPGTFAMLYYRPSGSRWSVFGLVTPRFYFYRDPNAVDPLSARSGYGLGMKPEFIFNVSPTLGYRVSELVNLRLGTMIHYQKSVASNWSPFNGTHRSNDPSSPAWRLFPVALLAGVNIEINRMFSIFPYAATYPIAGQRIDDSPRSGGRQATLLQASSVGMWVNGTLF